MNRFVLLTRRWVESRSAFTLVTLSLRSIVISDADASNEEIDVGTVLTELDNVNISKTNSKANQNNVKKIHLRNSLKHHNASTENDNYNKKDVSKEKERTFHKSSNKCENKLSVAVKSESAEHENTSRIEQIRLIRQLRQRSNIKEKLRVMRDEENKLADRAILEETAASSPAKTFMSTSELIQTGSPQHLETYSDGGNCVKQLPRLLQSGSVAIVSLVGKVNRIYNNRDLEPNAEGAKDITSQKQNHVEVYTDMEIKFNSPTESISELTQTILVRCYGATLSSFASNTVQEGDLVHILGNLSVANKDLENSFSQSNKLTTSVMITVLPVGGNISVILPRSYEAELKQRECETASQKIKKINKMKTP